MERGHRRQPARLPPLGRPADGRGLAGGRVGAPRDRRRRRAHHDDPRRQGPRVPDHHRDAACRRGPAGCAARWRCTSPRTAGRSGYRMGKEVVTEEFQAAVPIDEQMGYDERVRLLYVACTRACDHLVVSLHRVERKNPPAKLSSRTNAEVLLAGMGSLVDGLPDLGGEPVPSPSRPRQRPVRAAPVRGVGRRARRGRWRSPPVPAPSPPPPSPTRAPRHGRPSPCWCRSTRRPPAVPVQASLFDEPGLPTLRPTTARTTAPTTATRARPNHRGARRRPRPAEAAPRPRPATVAEGPLRHRGRPGRARRAPDDRPRHRRRASTTPSPPSARPRRCPTAPTTCAGWCRRRSAPRRCRPRQPLRTGARCTPARPIGDRLLEGYVDLLYRGADGLVVVDHKTSASRRPRRARPPRRGLPPPGRRLRGGGRPSHRRAGHPGRVPLPHAPGRRRARARRPRRRHGRRRAPRARPARSSSPLS